MAGVWLPLKDIPAEGREFSFSDQSLWTGPAVAFGMQLAVAEPLAATLLLVPRQRGVYLKGRLTGTVAAPCDRCSEDARVDIAHDFEFMDDLPEPGQAQADDSWLREGKGGPELDAAGLLWEQFVLALPAHSLCDPACKGLCAHCGANLNQGPCGCASAAGDLRLAALHGLKVGKKE